MSMEQNSRMIDINVLKGNEYKTLVMDIYKETEFFHEAFIKAAGVITEIVDTAGNYVEDNKNLEHQLLINYPNNILAFCAERGQGKTSAMLSMADALRKLNDLSADERHTRFWNEKVETHCYFGTSNPVLNTRFEVLDPIDPTMMGKSDSIIKNVISKMFKIAEEKWNKSDFHHRSNVFNPSTKEKMLKTFVECFRASDHLKQNNVNSSTAYDDLNLLAEYGDSASFKESLHDLVKLYLDFMSTGSDRKKTFLVLQIDDADLNIRNAHAISEEIRKYFVMPNIIVMMALNADTMRFTIEQYFLRQYRYYAAFGDKELIQNKCHEIMEKYIEKLLPAAHRVNIPKVNDYIRDGFNHINLNYLNDIRCGQREKTDDIAVVDELLLKDIEKKDLYQEKLISLIYQKTGIILVKPECYLHEFLPSSMRMLNHFLVFITGLDDLISYRDGEEIGTFSEIFKQIKSYQQTKDAKIKAAAVGHIEKALSNLKKFSDYFLHTWCNMTLSGKEMELIDTISSTSREKKIQRTIELLNRHCNMSDKVESFVPFSAIIAQLHKLRTGGNLHKYLHLISAVEMYYTIYFHTLIFECMKSWISDEEKMKETTPFAALVDLIGYSVFPIAYYDEKQLRKIIIKNPVVSHGYNYNSNYRFCSNFLCEISFDTKLIQYHKPVVHTFEAQKRFGFTSEYSYFDIFRPLVSILSYDGFANDFLNPDGGFDAGIISSSLNIISNVDIQNLLYNHIFRKTEDNMNTSTDSGNSDIISGLYHNVDSVIKEKCTVKTESNWAEALQRREDGKEGLLETSPLHLLFRIMGDDNSKVEEADRLKGLFCTKPSELKQFINCVIPIELFQESDKGHVSTQEFMNEYKNEEKKDDKATLEDQHLNDGTLIDPEQNCDMDDFKGRTIVDKKDAQVSEDEAPQTDTKPTEEDEAE